ncbi:MAG: hypothetical protein BGN92_06750 [Sphingobacteriales bacterium 41-5]|nr:MAG: hypothetical protein BGN92_06750 [Sphingobacteriales bacterium 41-5]
MNFKLLLFYFLVVNTNNIDYQPFFKEFGDDISKMIRPPKEYLEYSNIDFYYSQLIKIKVDNKYNISSIKVSDGSSEWFKEDIEMLVKKGRVNFDKFNRLAKKNKIKNCELILPVEIVSDNYPKINCKLYIPNQNFYMFDNKNLAGTIIFGNRITISYSYAGIKK